MMDLTGYTDEELVSLCDEVTEEMNRRKRLVTLPEDVRHIAQQYCADGGEVADLQAVLDDLSS